MVVAMHKKVSVLKFGGTSVGSGERICQVAAIIESALREYRASDGFFPVIVVSAMAGVTDQLLRIARHACSGEREAYEKELALLRLKHLDAAKIVAQNAAKHALLVEELEECLSLFDKRCLCIARICRTGARGFITDGCRGLLGRASIHSSCRGSRL